MEFKINDGGRAKAGFRGETGDCVCRAIAIATEKPYKEVYDTINQFAKSERTGKRKKSKSNARIGVYKDTIKKVMAYYGWEWIPTMQIGSGCQVHLSEDELPKGRLVVSLSKHLTAVIDGVINDTYDCSRDGTRCVYGYFHKPKQINSEIKHCVRNVDDNIKDIIETFNDIKSVKNPADINERWLTNLIDFASYLQEDAKQLRKLVRKAS